MSMFKRILAGILSAVIVFSSFSPAVNAAEITGAVQEEIVEETSAEELVEENVEEKAVEELETESEPETESEQEVKPEVFVVEEEITEVIEYATGTEGEKTVVEEVEDMVEQISLVNAQMMDPNLELGDIAQIEVKSKEFGRIATQNAKNVILQKIREEERKVIFDEYNSKEKDVVTGIIQRYVGKNVSINLGKADALLTESEQIKGESYVPTERIKVYILEVKSTSKGPKILVSRTHPELVKRLFESEVTEVKDGIVEIKSISREAGSRTKIAVWSNDPDVDPVGACVGMNGARVNTIVEELRGEKIDIITWDENPAILIQNALSPAKVISVIADGDEKTAKVVVPDYQLSLAIGKEGQNARLAARLTGFKIDIKSETQARESGDFMDYENDYLDEEYYDEDEYYDEEYNEEGYNEDEE